MFHLAKMIKYHFAFSVHSPFIFFRCAKAFHFYHSKKELFCITIKSSFCRVFCLHEGNIFYFSEIPWIQNNDATFTAFSQLLFRYEKEKRETKSEKNLYRIPNSMCFHHFSCAFLVCRLFPLKIVSLPPDTMA